MHRDAHSEPFAELGDAWHRFLTGQNDHPVFKKKGKTPDSFYIANDKLQLRPDAVRIPKIGWVSLTEPSRLCRENQAIGIETLSVEGMLKNYHLAQAIAAQGFGQFFRMLTYKVKRYGTQLVPASRWFSSSKLCSTPGWGYLNKEPPLKDHEWVCPSCGMTHDHDINALRNMHRLETETALPVDAFGNGRDGIRRSCAESGVGRRRESHACEIRSETRWL